MGKPSGLPIPGANVTDSPSEGLPAAKAHGVGQQEASLQAKLEQAEHCKKCGTKMRVVSNHLGVNAHCGKCRTHVPFSASPLSAPDPYMPGRGIGKETTVDLTDYNIAFENDL